MKYRVAILVACSLIIVVGLVSWITDRAPPFEILEVEPVVAVAGQPVKLRAKVRRDLHRHCDVSFNRQLYLPGGYRALVDGQQEMSAAQLSEMDFRASGALLVVIDVPPWAPPGRAELVTNLRYFCNPWHRWISPISVTATMPFEVTQ
jgi:hypothetical protein